ncbi:MAG: FecR family protein [Oceanospirillum sp.]|nr:FecR family protein [Oceanospirillum sp.]
MKIAAVLVTFLLTVIAWSAPATAEPAIVGHVDGVRGGVQLIRMGSVLAISADTLIQEGDQLQTEAGGRVRIRFRDNTRIVLAETTQFQVKRYRFNPEKEHSDARFKLISGAFRAVTGAIGQQENPTFEVETPVATMGIRGTDFWGGFIFNGDLDVAMFSGKGVYVRNTLGQVELIRQGEGVTVKEGLAPADPKLWPEWKLQEAIDATRLSP